MDNLERVQDIQGITKCIGADERNGVLLLSPVGQPFSSERREDALLPSAEHFGQLVNIVQKAHQQAKLVHRDLSLSNFFLGPDAKVRSGKYQRRLRAVAAIRFPVGGA